MTMTIMTTMMTTPLGSVSWPIATRSTPSCGRTTSPWSGNEYGYGWFGKTVGGHRVHFAWGYGGQMLFVVPDLRLTVVMISDPTPRPRAESHLPALHMLLDQGIIPAAERGATPT